MLELPECATLARQINETLAGHHITEARAGFSPHGFAFYTGNPDSYAARLNGLDVIGAAAFGGILEVGMQGLTLLLSDGANLRYLAPGARLPDKHQLLLRFDGGCALAVTVQMYAGIHLCEEGRLHSDYHRAAREKPSPLGGAFTPGYFLSLAEENPRLSVKALLAAQQRIPGLGNGVLQDILFSARVNPRTRAGALSRDALAALHGHIRDKLKEMTALGGRDTEKDLFGRAGGYRCLMSKNTADKPCPACGGKILREAYMGGYVYYCPACQPYSGRS